MKMMSTSKHHLRLPDDLESAQAKLVYLALSVEEETTVSDLQRQLHLPKLTLLSVLESLRRQDLARRTEERYVAQ